MSGSFKIGVAILAVGVVATSFREASGQAAPPEQAIEQLQPVKLEAADSPLRRLLKERFNTSVEEVQAVTALWYGGKTVLEEVATAVARFAKAGVEMAETPAERIKYLALALSQAKTTESFVREKYNAGGAGVDELLRARGLRLDAEIALLRERDAAK
jgi:hypothetical protein